MSQENVEVAYRVFDALARRDRDAWVALHDSDAKIHPLIGLGGTYRGHDGAQSFWDDVFRTFPDYSVRIDEVRELGDRTLLAVHISARGAHAMDSAGSMVEQLNWILAEMRDGRVVWWRTFRTEPEALDAAGLREQ